MKQVDTIPTSGRFVAVWEENGDIESGYFFWSGYYQNESLWEYDDDGNPQHVQPENILSRHDVKIFVALSTGENR